MNPEFCLQQISNIFVAVYNAAICLSGGEIPNESQIVKAIADTRALERFETINLISCPEWIRSQATSIEAFVTDNTKELADAMIIGRGSDPMEIIGDFLSKEPANA